MYNHSDLSSYKVINDNKQLFEILQLFKTIKTIHIWLDYVVLDNLSKRYNGRGDWWTAEGKELDNHHIS